MEVVVKEFVIYRGEGDNEKEIILTILGDAEPYVPAYLSGHPDSWEPASGGSGYIEAIYLDGKPWCGKLTHKEEAEAEEAIYNQCIEKLRSIDEAAAEAKFERMNEYYDGLNY